MIDMIVAVSKNYVIGKDGKLPWHIPADLKQFKELTMNGILFVGKNTAKTLPKLPGREVIVLHRNEYPTIEDVVDIAHSRNRAGWIIGGAQIYRAAFKQGIVRKVYMTLIDKQFDGDAYFSFDCDMVSSWVLESEEIISQEPLARLQVWRNTKSADLHI